MGWKPNWRQGLSNMLAYASQIPQMRYQQERDAKADERWQAYYDLQRQYRDWQTEDRNKRKAYEDQMADVAYVMSEINPQPPEGHYFGPGGATLPIPTDKPALTFKQNVDEMYGAGKIPFGDYWKYQYAPDEPDDEGYPSYKKILDERYAKGEITFDEYRNLQYAPDKPSKPPQPSYSNLLTLAKDKRETAINDMFNRVLTAVRDVNPNAFDKRKVDYNAPAQYFGGLARDLGRDYWFNQTPDDSVFALVDSLGQLERAPITDFMGQTQQVDEATIDAKIEQLLRELGR